MKNKNQEEIEPWTLNPEHIGHIRRAKLFRPNCGCGGRDGPPLPKVVKPGRDYKLNFKLKRRPMNLKYFAGASWTTIKLCARVKSIFKKFSVANEQTERLSCLSEKSGEFFFWQRAALFIGWSREKRREFLSRTFNFGNISEMDKISYDL